VRKRLTDKDSDLVALAALAAGQLGDREAVPVLRKLLASEFELYRGNAAAALGLLGDAESAPVLRKMLADPDENLRAAAAEALGRLRDPDARPLLQALAERDPFPWVRDVAHRAVAAWHRIMAAAPPTAKPATFDAVSAAVRYGRNGDTIRGFPSRPSTSVKASDSRMIATAGFTIIRSQGGTARMKASITLKRAATIPIKGRNLGLPVDDAAAAITKNPTFAITAPV
jgi:hypothetical protein